MARYLLSARAKRDVREIAAYSVTQWGLDRAYEYIASLYAGCELIADFPEVGRPLAMDPAIRRFERNKHVIFYRTAAQIRVIRILHQCMLPTSGLLDEKP